MSTRVQIRGKSDGVTLLNSSSEGSGFARSTTAYGPLLRVSGRMPPA